MGMNVFLGGSSSELDVMVDINIMLLIDVMLVLLIMLIIMILIQMYLVKMDLLVGNLLLFIVLLEVVQIDIDFDGMMMWDGVLVLDCVVFEVKLMEVVYEFVQVEIYLWLNKLVLYKDVVVVLVFVQCVGVMKIGLVGNEQFM